MTAEKTLALATDALNAYKNAESIPDRILTGDPYALKDWQPVAGALLCIIEGAKADIARNSAKAQGRNMVLTAAKDVLKDVDPYRAENLAGGHTREDGKQEICNNYLAVVLNQPVMLPEVKGFPDLQSKIIDATRKNCDKPLELPDAAQLATQIKTEKATRPAKQKHYAPAPYKLGDVLVNPVYLLDILRMLPDCSAYWSGHQLDLIYFESDAGEAALCAVRPAHYAEA